MSEAIQPEFEALLRRALAPVDPPEGLGERLETALSDLHAMATDELDSWELGAMRDPRNWVRPVVAGTVATGAGAALVLVRTRQKAKSRRGSGATPLQFAERTLDDLVTEVRKIIR